MRCDIDLHSRSLAALKSGVGVPALLDGCARQCSTRPSRRRWLDIGQISDAMFMPFVEAVASRLPSGAPDIESHTHVAPNTTLGAYCTGRTTLDTGLRVLGRPILKLQETGAFVCEALPDEGFLLIYQPNRNEDLK
ncbi:hypothetical protein WS97_00700 [Burkholderia territorii]|uniref:hypothetical protein n=1 Tax=Burkholderia territorii TaxID=1503055 RepID=UPI00075F099B|nr:hypothetical protein [Burkholderia territorii]KVL25470.1 hypothetical protein WS97_00700 [Burkholderia territorii]